MTVIEKYCKDKSFFKDNFWLFTGFFLHGSFSYIYHFLMGRVLGPIDYGVLGAILSITYLITVFIQVIQLSITKRVSEFNVQQEFPKIKYLLMESFKKILMWGCGISLIFLVFSSSIASFLKIKNNYLIAALGLFVIVTFLLAVIRGTIQGLQKFKLLATNYALEGFVKLMLGGGLVLLGYGVGGALGGIIVSFIAAFVFALLAVRLTKETKKFDFKPFYSSSFKTLMVLASLTFIYSIDVILVKHFLNGIESGYYAALSTLGKIIFFASYSVSYVMFSKVSEYKKNNKKITALLSKSLILTTLIGVPILLFYLFFPEFSIKLLFGSAFLAIKPYLGLFGVFMLLFSLVYTISFYNLSLDKTKFVYLLFIFNILEIVLICLFHNSIIQIIYILIILMLLLLITLLAYTGVFKHRTFINNSGV